MIEITEEEYKAAKEAHVSGCTGGSVMEINLVCLSLVVKPTHMALHLQLPLFTVIQ